MVTQQLGLARFVSSGRRLHPTRQKIRVITDISPAALGEIAHGDRESCLGKGAGEQGLDHDRTGDHKSDSGFCLHGLSSSVLLTVPGCSVSLKYYCVSREMYSPLLFKTQINALPKLLFPAPEPLLTRPRSGASHSPCTQPTSPATPRACPNRHTVRPRSKRCSPPCGSCAAGAQLQSP